jgi:competence ComEA-like helix-hairpin-helix protein
MGTTPIPQFSQDSVMRWIYQLQQRIAITQIECNVIMCFALLFAVGLTARYVQSSPNPLPDTAYAETMQRFEQVAATVATEATPIARPAAADTVLADTPDATETNQAPRTRTKALPAVRMNLNTASASQLQRLPRIGPKMAERILAYRTEHGDFERVADLQKVRGIGEKTLANLIPYLFVEGESS